MRYKVFLSNANNFKTELFDPYIGPSEVLQYHYSTEEYLDPVVTLSW